MNPRLKIAIAGTRGIPARYGGFETFAEELGRRLAERGHQVTIYCRGKHSSPGYMGTSLVWLPTIRHKYFDTLAHTFVSTLHLLVNRHDVALYCNAANAIFTWMPRVVGTPVALNVDGLERKRRKWNALARGWYRVSEWLATFCPTAVVSDAVLIADYYRSRYAKETTFIPYGAELGPVSGTDVLRELGLEPGEYFLYVSRLEPENNALLVREAFERLDTKKKLVLVGDAPYAHEYIRAVRNTTDQRVLLPGAIYGDGYRQLQSHCFAYVHATEVGGTHPALIEAMGREALVLYLRTPENEEVAGGAGISFENDLAEQMTGVLSLPSAVRDAYKQAARERVQQRYSWDAVTDDYERLLTSLVGLR